VICDNNLYKGVGMGMPSMPELLIVFGIVFLLFGAKKIPDLAKGLGEGIKEFKKSLKEETHNEKKEPNTTSSQTLSESLNKDSQVL
jgi:sec-independent protein translocase protein TatA